jgi:dUTP pyrophosphatase
MKIKIKKLHPDAVLPKYAHSGDAGMDLFSVEEYELKPGERKIFPVGFALEFPKGFAAIVKDKGGPPYKWGVHTMGGVFDAGYRGEYNVNLINLGQEICKIEKGQKIAQLVIYPVEIVELEEVQMLSDTSRGEGRFGSTGLRDNLEIKNIESKPTREFLSTVYIVENGKVLLTWNKKVKKFIPLGGHVEENELPSDCAIREAKEESGYEIELIDLGNLKIRNLPQNLDIHLDIIKPDHHHINLSYIGRIVGGEMLRESDECTELKWFSKEEIEAHPEIFDNTREKALKSLELMKRFQELSLSGRGNG